MRAIQCDVPRSRPFVLTISLAVIAGTVWASPAQAAPQSLLGTTVEVVATTSGDSLLGGTAYIQSGGTPFLVTLGAPRASDVTATLIVGVAIIDTCTITAGFGDCVMNSYSALPAGAHAATVRFTMGATTADFTGTIFVVTNIAPTVRIEWHDAAGTWVDGSGTGLPLRGSTAMRCVVTNNSNAAITFTSFSSTVLLLSSPPSIVPITGTLTAGAIGYYPVWSGLVSEVSSASCSGSISVLDGTGNGAGTGGGLIPVDGTITIDRTPAPGITVTITGDEIVPTMVAEYSVLLDGVAVAGSPVAAPGPDYDFVIDVDVPASLAAGDHVITVVATFDSRNIAYAAFPFSVADPELAATGAAMDAPLGFGALALLSGLAMLLTARRRRVA
jgi:hypothetical protein